MSCVVEDPKVLNRLAREQIKKKLLVDILVNMKVCEIEGLDKM